MPHHIHVFCVVWIFVVPACCAHAWTRLVATCHVLSNHLSTGHVEPSSEIIEKNVRRCFGLPFFTRGSSQSVPPITLMAPYCVFVTCGVGCEDTTWASTKIRHLNWILACWMPRPSSKSVIAQPGNKVHHPKFPPFATSICLLPFSYVCSFTKLETNIPQCHDEFCCTCIWFRCTYDGLALDACTSSWNLGMASGQSGEQISIGGNINTWATTTMMGKYFSLLVLLHCVLCSYSSSSSSCSRSFCCWTIFVNFYHSNDHLRHELMQHRFDDFGSSLGCALLVQTWRISISMMIYPLGLIIFLYLKHLEFIISLHSMERLPLLAFGVLAGISSSWQSPKAIMDNSSCSRHIHYGFSLFCFMLLLAWRNSILRFVGQIFWATYFSYVNVFDNMVSSCYPLLRV